MSSANALWPITIFEPWTKKDIIPAMGCGWKWRVGGLSMDENWTVGDNMVINTHTSIGWIPLHVNTVITLVSVHYWGWISCEGAWIVQGIEGHLDSLQYKHTLQNVIVPSVWMLYPNGLIHFQQDHSSIHVAASSQRYVWSLIESMTRRMKSEVKAQGFWTSY